jgi:hypothetical protein
MSSEIRRLAMGMFPEGSVFGGRTARLPSKGRFSVVASTDKVFLPDGKPFTILFAGWSSATEPQLEGMRQWKGKATQVIVETGRADQAQA